MSVLVLPYATVGGDHLALFVLHLRDLLLAPKQRLRSRDGRDDGERIGIRAKLKQWRNLRCNILIAVVVFSIVLFGAREYFTPTSTFISKGFLSDVPERVFAFHQDDRFIQSPTIKGSAWDEIIPEGGGFVRLWPADYPEMSNLHSSGQDAQEFCISAFHQIHCLVTLKNVFDNYRSGKDVGTHHGLDPADHADHCFDYLRQSIMCSGDVSLESLSVYPNGTVARGVTGYGAVHRCKDWKAIMSFATAHKLIDYV